ncbi:hypothetical protein VTL71DRAFT_10233 [Oculimacula yallundae]|uniref:Uncharacterized protein n=1 Tax=Oculimacula yallundae TaxID=86028 RepID=A0ABR4BPM3_9HELO
MGTDEPSSSRCGDGQENQIERLSAQQLQLEQIERQEQREFQREEAKYIERVRGLSFESESPKRPSTAIRAEHTKEVLPVESNVAKAGKALTPLSKSQSKESMMRHLRISLAVFNMMAKETEAVHRLIASDKSYGQRKGDKDYLPYDWLSCSEESKEVAIMTLSRGGDEYTKRYWIQGDSPKDLGVGGMFRNQKLDDPNFALISAGMLDPRLQRSTTKRSITKDELFAVSSGNEDDHEKDREDNSEYSTDSSDSDSSLSRKSYDADDESLNTSISAGPKVRRSKRPEEPPREQNSRTVRLHITPELIEENARQALLAKNYSRLGSSDTDHSSAAVAEPNTRKWAYETDYFTGILYENNCPIHAPNEGSPGSGKPPGGREEPQQLINTSLSDDRVAKEIATLTAQTPRKRKITFVCDGEKEASKRKIVDIVERPSTPPYTGLPAPKKETIFIQEDEDQSDAAFITSSVPSVADSLFSLMSGSSVSSVIGPEGATERLVDLLLHRPGIGPPLASALALTGVQSVETYLRRSLKAFGIDLRREARTNEQRDAAHFVRFRARNTAHIICNMMGRVIKVAIGEPRDRDHVHSECASDESDSESSNEADEVQDHFQQLETFIQDSDAIKVLQASLEEYIKVIASIPRAAPISDPALLAMQDAQQPTDERCANQTTRVEDVIQRSDFDQAPDFTTRAWPTYLQKFSKSLAVKVGIELPEVALGKERIEWQCRCGMIIRDDFVELRPGGIECYKNSVSRKSSLGGATPCQQPTLRSDSGSTWLLRFCVASLFSLSVYLYFLLTVGANKLFGRTSAGDPLTQLDRLLGFIEAGSLLAFTPYAIAIVLGIYLDRARSSQAAGNTELIASNVVNGKFSAFSDWISNISGIFRMRTSWGDTHIENGLPLHQMPPSSIMQMNDTAVTSANITTTDKSFLLLCHDEGRYATRLLQLDMNSLHSTTDQDIFKALGTSYRSWKGRWTSMISLKTLIWIKFVRFEM